MKTVFFDRLQERLRKGSQYSALGRQVGVMRQIHQIRWFDLRYRRQPGTQYAVPGRVRACYCVIKNSRHRHVTAP